MAMNLHEVLHYMPLVCICILLAIGAAAEIRSRRGIQPTAGRASGGAGGYSYAAFDRTGAAYRFRIAGSARSGYLAYLEDAPGTINSSALRMDSSGRCYVPIRARSTSEAEQEVDRFVQQQ